MLEDCHLCGISKNDHLDIIEAFILSGGLVKQADDMCTTRL